MQLSPPKPKAHVHPVLRPIPDNPCVSEFGGHCWQDVDDEAPTDSEKEFMGHFWHADDPVIDLKDPAEQVTHPALVNPAAHLQAEEDVLAIDPPVPGAFAGQTSHAAGPVLALYVPAAQATQSPSSERV